MNSDSPGKGPHIPPIVSIVLTQAARLRAEGEITHEKFEAQMERLSKEELSPRGLTLLVRDLSDGRTRFLIKGRRGEVCDMIECDGTCHRASAA